MKLNVDLTELQLAASKISGLNSYLTALKKADMSYSNALVLAKEFALENEGTTILDSEDNVSITLFNEKVTCFKSLNDTDKFDFKTHS